MQTSLLRDAWGFEGYVVGDSDTVKFIDTEHHYVDSPAAAVRAALEAGTDLESWTDGDGMHAPASCLALLSRED